ncbi:MAG: protein deglycase HchA, partial [Flavobacteriales bacterium]
MLKKILIGLLSVVILAFIVIYTLTRPNLENDGSYSPSSLALSLGTVAKTDFDEIKYTKYQGDKSK